MKIPPTLLSPFCRVSDALCSDNFFGFMLFWILGEVDLWSECVNFILNADNVLNNIFHTYVCQ